MKRWTMILPVAMAAGLLTAPVAADTTRPSNAPPAREARSAWTAASDAPTAPDAPATPEVAAPDVSAAPVTPPAPPGATTGAEVLTGTALKDAAASATRAGRWNEAARLWDAVLNETPNDANASAELGWAMLQTGQNSEARREFTRALRLDPMNLRARGGLVQLAIRDHKPDEAVRLATETAQARPDSAAALRILGDAQIAATHRADAEDAYRRAVALDPNDALSHAGLANALFIRNKAEEAVREYRAAVRIDPANADFQEGLGRAAMVASHYGEAALAYADAMELASQPQPDWTRLDALSLNILDALGRASTAVHNGQESRQDAYDANRKLLNVTDALAKLPVIANADATTNPAMAQRALAYDLMGQASAIDLASLSNDSVSRAADAIVFREQARRAILSAQAASLPPAPNATATAAAPAANDRAAGPTPSRTTP